MYNAYVTKIQNIKEHSNADRLELAEVFGNTVCVSKDSFKVGELCLYFPCDGQLSLEFAEINNLLRKKDEQGNLVPGSGYMDPEKRNITAIRLRGEKSDGLILPLTALESFGDISTLKVGDIINVFNGHVICTKYILKRKNFNYKNEVKGNKTRKRNVPISPLFKEHADTEQLAYNLDVFKPGDEIEITLKMHGTSQRTGYLPVLQPVKKTFWQKLFRKEPAPVYSYDYISGTRRVIIENFEEAKGFYGSDRFREPHHKFFEGKLQKGETVYYEVVGFTHTGTPIMGDGDNKKLNDKEFVKRYGETTRFSYGCSPSFEPNIEAQEDENGYLPELPQSDIYVYRMTLTNEDGFVVEYTPDFMRYRCDQMGVKYVPLLWKGTIPEYPASKDDPTISAGDWIKNVAELFYDGPDPVGKTHIREGVVVRIINKPNFCAYKHKNWSFKAIEGIVKVSAEAPDMEEAQESIE